MLIYKIYFNVDFSWIWIVLHEQPSVKLSNMNLNYLSQLPAHFLMSTSESFCWPSTIVSALWEWGTGRGTDRIKDTIFDLRSNDMLGDGVCVHRIKQIGVKISKHGWEKDMNLDWVGQRSIIEKLRGFFLFKFWYIEKIWFLLSRAE